MLKTHVDIFDQWDEAIVQQLQQLADKHGAEQWTTPATYLHGDVRLLSVHHSVDVPYCGEIFNNSSRCLYHKTE